MFKSIYIVLLISLVLPLSSTAAEHYHINQLVYDLHRDVRLMNSVNDKTLAKKLVGQTTKKLNQAISKQLWTIAKDAQTVAKNNPYSYQFFLDTQRKAQRNPQVKALIESNNHLRAWRELQTRTRLDMQAIKGAFKHHGDRLKVNLSVMRLKDAPAQVRNGIVPRRVGDFYLQRGGTNGAGGAFLQASAMTFLMDEKVVKKKGRVKVAFDLPRQNTSHRPYQQRPRAGSTNFNFAGNTGFQ